VPPAISPKKRTPPRAFAGERRFEDRSLRLTPSHSLTEARRHGGERERERKREKEKEREE
jgi:hypothetical protein